MTSSLHSRANPHSNHASAQVKESQIWWQAKADEELERAGDTDGEDEQSVAGDDDDDQLVAEEEECEELSESLVVVGRMMTRGMMMLFLTLTHLLDSRMMSPRLRQSIGEQNRTEDWIGCRLRETRFRSISTAVMQTSFTISY